MAMDDIFVKAKEEYDRLKRRMSELQVFLRVYAELKSTGEPDLAEEQERPADVKAPAQVEEPTPSEKESHKKSAAPKGSTVTRIAELAGQGKMAKEIAEELGVSQPYVYQTAKKNHVKLPMNRRARWGYAGEVASEPVHVTPVSEREENGRTIKVLPPRYADGVIPQRSAGSVRES